MGVVCLLFVLTIVGLTCGFIFLIRKRATNFKTSPIIQANGHYKPNRRRAKRQIHDQKEQYLLLGGDDDVENELRGMLVSEVFKNIHD